MPSDSETSVPSKPKLKSRPWIAISAVIVLPVIGLILVSRLAQSGPRLTFSTCMKDAMFLREGAPVQMAGKQIGYVGATTQDDACPAKATVVITDPDARILADSTTSLILSKVTGETEMVINPTLVSGVQSPTLLQSGGTLPSTH